MEINDKAKMNLTDLTAQINGLQVDVDRNTLAVSLKAYRIRQGLTQAELGKMWGVSRYTLLRAEKAYPINWRSAYLIFVRLGKALAEEE